MCVACSMICLATYEATAHAEQGAKLVGVLGREAHFDG